MITDLDDLILINQIKRIFRKKNYVFFGGNRPYDLNLIGVRADNKKSNKFDDMLYCIYRDNKKDFIVNAWPITTDPGKYWLNKPMNPKGTAILIPGQYRKVWTMGMHQGKYPALCQRRPFKVWRDNNQDDILDFNGIRYPGLFGINCHRSNPYSQSYTVDKWSAGCQVHKIKKNFDRMMDLCLRSLKTFGNKFTYTLLDETDFYNL